MQRREEEGKGRERRRALLEREERKWKELEISLLSSIPNTGSRDAAAMAAAVRAVGGDSALEDSFARERVSSIANHIRKAQLSRRAEQVLSLDNPKFCRVIKHTPIILVLYKCSFLVHIGHITSLGIFIVALTCYECRRYSS